MLLIVTVLVMWAFCGIWVIRDWLIRKLNRMSTLSAGTSRWAAAAARSSPTVVARRTSLRQKPRSSSIHTHSCHASGMRARRGEPSRGSEISRPAGSSACLARSG